MSMHKTWCCLGEVPYWFSRSSIKFQGQAAKKSSILTQIECFRTVTPVWIHQCFETMHKAWSSTKDVPYCFSRSSVKFQGHARQKIIDFDPNWAFPDCNSSLNTLMAMKWCTKLEAEYKTCPVVFQGRLSDFKVTDFKVADFKVADFDPNLAFLDCNASFNSLMALNWCTTLDAV